MERRRYCGRSVVRRDDDVMTTARGGGCGAWRRLRWAAAAAANGERSPPQQCANAMKTVRSCFAAAAAAAAVLWLAVGHRSVAGNVTVVDCCTDSGDGRLCRNGNRTFRAIEAIGGACDGNATAAPVRKCCPPDQTYDPDVRFCRATVSADRNAFRRRLLPLLLLPHRFPETTMTVGYDYDPPKCNSTDVLVDVPAGEVRQLLDAAGRSDSSLPDGYCFDLTTVNASELVARTCRPREQYCRGRYTCVNKCCKDDRMIVNKSCQKSQVPFRTPPVYRADGDGAAAVRTENTPLPFHARLECANRITLYADGYTLLADGSLRVSDAGGARLPAANYCLEHAAAAVGQEVRLEVFVCAAAYAGWMASIKAATAAADASGSWKYLIMLAGFVPSIVCLAATMAVYAALSSLRNVHGYYVMCYVGCLLVSFVCLLVVQWMPRATDSTSCKLFGYLTLFSFYTTFSWLNVICFDIYWMLRYNNSINKSASISIRSILYNIYCWGFSSIYISTAFLFQHSKKTVLQKLAPNIGIYRCWFYNTDYGTVIFFLLPVSVMLVANLILFVLTAMHCSRIKSELNKFKRTDSKTQRFKVDKEKFAMSIKLFLVMGIPWSFEILSRIFQNDWFIWNILDEINALQGVMIFFIFVAKRKVIISLRKKIFGSLDHNESTKMHTISGSSQSGSAHKNNYDF